MAKDKVNLSIFRIKSLHADTVRSELVEASDALPLRDSEHEGSFVAVPGQARPPSWAAAVTAILQQPVVLNLTSQSAGGLLVIKRNGETYVISFGHAWLRLKDEWLERDFGRRVALNAIPKDGLIEVGAEQVFAKWHIARERAPKATGLEEFGVEYDRDLVSAVEGVPVEKVFGSVLRGGTSLRVTIPIDDLARVLDGAHVLFKSNKYLKHWPEIDNLVPIDDVERVDQLDALLDRDLKDGEGADRVILFSPMLRKENVALTESFVFGRLSKSPASTPYLTFSSWESHLKRTKAAPSIEMAKQTTIHLLGEANEEITKCSVYECFGYETSIGGRQYVLSSGMWYEAVAEFAKSIERRIDRLRKPPVLLPNWDQIVDEGTYNADCFRALKPDLLHFDAKNIGFGGGKSKFEFCDLMHPHKRILYFAKIPSRSADFSHLSEQVRRTVELLFSPDPKFRKKLKEKMKDIYPKAERAWLDARPRPGDWNLCLVSLGRRASDLPFFAKCGLARLVKELEEGGHHVSFQAV